MARYRYRKITPEILKKMKELREQGLFYYEIAKKFGVDCSTARYHLSPREKIMAKKRGKKYNSEMTEKQKREKIERAAPRMKKYIRERYNNDSEFRRRFLDNVLRSQRRIRNQRRKQGLCSKCGKERKDKRWVLCERCREAFRKKYLTKKSKTRK